jgi:hypothetical protein
MSEIIQVPGAAHVLINSGGSSALQGLGYTENGAEVREELLAGDIPGDQNGGDQGPPIDIQKFGLIGHVHLEMSKFDLAVAQYVIAKSNPNGGIATGQGVSPTPGNLIFSNTDYFRLLLFPAVNASFVRNFLIAVPREAHTYNLGTKYARFITDWICYPPLGGGTYWNLTFV